MADLSKKKITTTHKAWNLVRMAFLWGRKVGVFKRWQLRILLSKHLKTLAHFHHHKNGDSSFLFRYGERQLSFDETPLFNVKKKKKMHCPASIRLLLPCISHPVDFDYDFEIDGQNYSDEVISYGYDEEEHDRNEEEDKGVDVRAEEFIAKFYEQIKLQRQISYLEYKEHNDVVLSL